MKKAIIIALLSILTISMIIPTASAAAAGEPVYNISTATKNTDGSYRFQITVSKPESGSAYSGVTFWISLPSGVTFVNISYNLPGGAAWTPEEAPTKPGNYHFGYWAESNIFTGDITCTINVKYAGTGETALTVSEIGQNIYKEDIGGADQLVAKPNTSVQLSPNAPITDPNDGNDSGNGDGNGNGNGNGNSGNNGGSGSVTRPIPGDTSGETYPPLTANFPFTDVKESDWFYSDVFYMWKNGLMNGTSETLFSPNALLTRGMVVTVLWRMQGSPDATDLDMPFSDVANIWYYNAVKWAAENGVVIGYPDGTFCPNNNIYRQDLTLILKRYADFTKSELTVTREYAAFNDNPQIGAYAKDAVEALYKSGIINGRTGNIFDPKGNATRAEFAAMLHRFLEP